MPEREHLHRGSAQAVVEKVVDTLEMETTNTSGSSVGRDRSDPRLGSKEREGLAKLLVNRPRSERAVQFPPFSRAPDVAVGTACDTKRDLRRQVRRRGRLSRTSSPETISPRSASAIERRSSASSSGVSSNLPSASRATTVTTEPSSRVIPSTTTLPPTTFPVATFMAMIILRASRERPMTPKRSRPAAANKVRIRCLECLCSDPVRAAVRRPYRVDPWNGVRRPHNLPFRASHRTYGRYPAARRAAAAQYAFCTVSSCTCRPCAITCLPPTNTSRIGFALPPKTIASRRSSGPRARR
jgi:hypothetical protein